MRVKHLQYGKQKHRTMENPIAEALNESLRSYRCGLRVDRKRTALAYALPSLLLYIHSGIIQTTFAANELLNDSDDQILVQKFSTFDKNISDVNGTEENKNTFVDRVVTSIKSWLYPARCLQIPNNTIEFGAISTSDWQKWLGSHKINSIGGIEFLELGQDQNDYFLRQMLIPSDKGSPRVNFRARVKAKRTYRLSQRIFLEPEFDWGRKNQGGKLGFGFGGGTAPTGGQVKPDGFTARFMWRGNGDDSAHIAVYSYAADRSQNIPYGDDHPLRGFDVPVGEWFTLVMEVESNSHVDSADGSLKAWANGQKLVELEDIHWQSEGDQPAIHQLMFSTFYGGASIDWAPNRPTHIRFTDVCWAPVVEGYSAIQP